MTGISLRSEEESYYAASLDARPDYAILEGEEHVDVAIIGGGLTGVSAALELALRGYRTCVLESHYPGWGASGRNGGQVLFGFGCSEKTLERRLGRERARLLFDLSRAALQLIRERIESYRIDCDYRPGHIHVAIKSHQEQWLRQWHADLLRDYDYPTRLWERDELRHNLASERYRMALYDARSGHLHPLKYTCGLAAAAQRAGAALFQQSRVSAFKQAGRKIHVHAGRGHVICDNLLFATNAYLGRLHRRLAAYIMPVGTYIIATEPLGAERAAGLIKTNVAVADMNLALDYFRLSADHRLLFGGRAHYSARPPLSIRRALRRRMVHVFPQCADLHIDYAWGGLVGITRNRAPHLGKLASHIYYAHGYSGHGLAMSGMAGRIIAQAIAGEQEKLALFEDIRHKVFPGGDLLRMPLLALAGFYGKLQNLL